MEFNTLLLAKQGTFWIMLQITFLAFVARAGYVVVGLERVGLSRLIPLSPFSNDMKQKKMPGIRTSRAS